MMDWLSARRRRSGLARFSLIFRFFMAVADLGFIGDNGDDLTRLSAEGQLLDPRFGCLRLLCSRIPRSVAKVCGLLTP